MALSGRYLIALAIAALTLVAFAGCQNGGEAGSYPAGQARNAGSIMAKRIEPGEQDARMTAPAQDPGKSTLQLAQRGAPISTDEASYTLPMLHDGRLVQPVAAVGKRFLLQEQPANYATGAAPVFELWDPANNSYQPAWTGEPGRQDVVGGASGDWVATVRTGNELPFADWSLILRNVATGEARTLATADQGAESVDGLRPDLPLGFAPLPSISGHVVAWDAYFATARGAGKHVLAYDIDTQTTREVAVVSDATREDLRLPAVGGELAAWVHRDFATHEATVEVANLETGVRQTAISAGNPWAVSLSGDGQILAWDDDLSAKYAMHIDSREATQYATTEGWGTTTNGREFSWMPAAAQGGAGGFYDPARNEVRLLPKKQAVSSNVAGLFGDWFVWQEISRGDQSAAKYYFLPLDR